MKIYVEGNYKRHNVVSINAKGERGNLWITKRQYASAMRRLGLSSSDYLRLAPVCKDGGNVMVYNNDKDYAIIT